MTPLATPLSKMNWDAPTRLVAVVQAVASAGKTLASLHDKRIYHRDIKPENLFMLNGQVYIGDLGLADVPGKDAVTEIGEFLGPLFYIAPEMMTNAADIPAGPADVYSLAKTLWVLATGQTYPVPGEQRTDVPALTLSAYVTTERANLLDIVVERATAHDPIKRLTMAEFASHLEGWVAPMQSSGDSDLGPFTERLQAALRGSQDTQLRIQEGSRLAEETLNRFNDCLETITQKLRDAQVSPQQGANDTVRSVVAAQSKLRDRVQDPLTIRGNCVVIAREEIGKDPAYLWSGVGVEVWGISDIYVTAGHVLGYGSGRKSIIWFDETVSLIETADLQHAIQRLSRGLLQQLPVAIERFLQVCEHGLQD